MKKKQEERLSGSPFPRPFSQASASLRLAVDLPSWLIRHAHPIGWAKIISDISKFNGTKRAVARFIIEVISITAFGGPMTISTILIIILILLLVGALPTWPHSRSWNYGPSGLVGFLLLVVIILMLMRVI